nr:MAG TPA: hypothetical protein [Caudoviricetes sp.]
MAQSKEIILLEMRNGNIKVFYFSAIKTVSKVNSLGI